MKTQLVGSINGYRLGKMPSPSQTTGDIMIMDYPYIEVYMPDDIKHITDNYVKRNRREVVIEYKEEYPESEAHAVTVINVWNNAINGQGFGKQHVKGIKTLTDVLFWEQRKLGVDIHNKMVRILNPNSVREEFVRRNLHWRDVYEEDKKHIYSFSGSSIRNLFSDNQKSKPSWDIITYLTKYIIEFDNNLLELPKNKGVRWDMDEWRRTSNIKVKQSWEEEKD